MLYSNRALAQLKLQQWHEANVDCSMALFYDGQNVKAQYRRATARTEVGMATAALHDIVQVLSAMHDDRMRHEVVALKAKIEAMLGAAARQAHFDGNPG